jgi:hypothetical protein
MRPSMSLSLGFVLGRPTNDRVLLYQCLSPLLVPSTIRPLLLHHFQSPIIYFLLCCAVGGAGVAPGGVSTKNLSWPFREGKKELDFCRISEAFFVNHTK